MKILMVDGLPIEWRNDDSSHVKELKELERHAKTLGLQAYIVSARDDFDEDAADKEWEKAGYSENEWSDAESFEDLINLIAESRRETKKHNGGVSMIEETGKDVFNFLKNAAIDGAKNSVAKATSKKINSLVKKKLAGFYPAWLQKGEVGKLIDELIIPTALYAICKIYPSLPRADVIEDFSYRAAVSAFQDRASVALDKIKPLFKDIGKILDEEPKS